MNNYLDFLKLFYDNCKNRNKLKVTELMKRYGVGMSSVQRMDDLGFIFRERDGLEHFCTWTERKPNKEMAELLEGEVKGTNDTNYTTLKHF